MSSTTDDRPLDALERRGRAAARSLREDLARRDRTIAGGPASVAHPLTPETDSPAAAEPAVIRLDRPAGRARERRVRRQLIAAAVVAAALGVAGVIAFGTADDDAARVSSGSGSELLPRWLPAGYEPVEATGVPDPGAAGGFSYDVAAYGDPGADDPWSAPVVVSHIVAGEDLLGGPPSGGEAVTVAGHEARLRRAEGIGEEWSLPAWEVEWQADDGRMIVAAPLRREEVLAAAAAATTEPAIGASGLPHGYAELARGPMVDSTLFTSLFEGAADGTGLAVTYADPSDHDAARPGVRIAQRPGSPSSVDLLRLVFSDVRPVTVRGHHAVIGRGDELPGSAGEDGVVAVHWAESEGQLVTVIGFGVAEADVLHVAEGLRPASADEVTALREHGVVAAPREFEALPDGRVVVATGESPTGQWRIVADAGRRENIGSLTIERLWGASASTVSTTGDRTEPGLDLQADISDGTIVVWGMLGVEAATVTVEAPGQEAVPMGLHEVEGWSRPVVAGALPVDPFGRRGDEIAIVARDATGREVARDTTVLGRDS
jgi:hypothetical protein